MNTLLLMAALLLGQTCDDQASLSFGSVRGRPGEIASVEVRGHSECLTTGLAFAVTYDQSQLEFLSADWGPWIESATSGDFYFKFGDFPGEDLAVVVTIWEDLAFPIRLQQLPVPRDTVLATLRFLIYPFASEGRVALGNISRFTSTGFLIQNSFSGPPGGSTIHPVIREPGVVLVGGAPERGDCSDDGLFDLSDAVYTLNVLFFGSGSFPCPDACNVNGDSQVDLSDAVYSLMHLYASGPAPVGGVTTCP